MVWNGHCPPSHFGWPHDELYGLRGCKSQAPAYIIIPIIHPNETFPDQSGDDQSAEFTLAPDLPNRSPKVKFVGTLHFDPVYARGSIVEHGGALVSRIALGQPLESVVHHIV